MNGKNEMLSKFKNIYMMILFAITNQSLKDIKHYLSDDVTKKIERMILTDQENNERHFFDEANISDVTVINEEKKQDKNIITIMLIVNCMDYYVDLKNGNYIRGVNDHRIKKIQYLTFTKLDNTKEITEVMECPYCGSSMAVNHTGLCDYCRKTIDMSKYDYILTSIE